MDLFQKFSVNLPFLYLFATFQTIQFWIIMGTCMYIADLQLGHDDYRDSQAYEAQMTQSEFS
jgi:hypothetical protein